MSVSESIKKLGIVISKNLKESWELWRELRDQHLPEFNSLAVDTTAIISRFWPIIGPPWTKSRPIVDGEYWAIYAPYKGHKPSAIRCVFKAGELAWTSEDDDQDDYEDTFPDPPVRTEQLLAFATITGPAPPIWAKEEMFKATWDGKRWKRDKGKPAGETEAGK